MPKGIFRSCEEIIEQQNNGLVYKNIDELNSTLRDPQRMKELKTNASAVSRTFAFEAQANEFAAFFKELLFCMRCVEVNIMLGTHTIPVVFLCRCYAELVR